MGPAMRPNLPPPSGAHPAKQPTRQAATGCAFAEATLGQSHPLTAVLRSSQTAKEQALAIAAVQIADFILLLQHAPLALPLALACGAVQIALGLRIAYLTWRRREICRQLIADGREQLPLPAVQRELRRLGGAQCQVALAQSIDRLADEVAQARSRPGNRPIYHRCVLRAVTEPLHEIARLLRSGDAPVRGVAQVESLLTSGGSPLYGAEVEPLREELARARYFLAGRR